MGALFFLLVHSHLNSDCNHAPDSLHFDNCIKSSVDGPNLTTMCSILSTFYLRFFFFFFCKIAVDFVNPGSSAQRWLRLFTCTVGFDADGISLNGKRVREQLSHLGKFVIYLE